MAGIIWQRRALVVLGTILLSACSGNAGPERMDAYLIRAGETTVTAQDFHDAYEVAKVAYTHNALQDPAVVREVKRRLLYQLSDEVVLLERARALGITISDAELRDAVSAVKADYPEGVFEETLLESAISFGNWVGRLRVRLLVERVAKVDLEQRVEIAPEDVLRYFDVEAPDHDDVSTESGVPAVNETSVNHMRRIKAEESYHQWMKALRQVHRVEVDQSLWQEVSGV